MDSSVLGGLLIIAVAGAVIASAIAYHRSHCTGLAVSFFVLGALFPLIGIILALFVKPLGGWYPDPWQQAGWRWWDGKAWTAHTSQPGEAQITRG
jgi:hypothetical protein